MALRLLLAAVAIPLLTLSIASCGSVPPEAKPATEAWLALVDGGQYAESWTEAASFFKDKIDSASWEKSVNAVRAPLGKVQSRAVKSATAMKSLPGAPDGEYVVFQFETSFEKTASAVETVTPMKDKDGRAFPATSSSSGGLLQRPTWPARPRTRWPCLRRRRSGRVRCGAQTGPRRVERDSSAGDANAASAGSMRSNARSAPTVRIHRERRACAGLYTARHVWPFSSTARSGSQGVRFDPAVIAPDGEVIERDKCVISACCATVRGE